ncbi:MAG: hypothetical protein FWF76_02200 [Oscillospiraceae bacterium]|nr:hypothetical protein [Oscillospiraceae bacterium]
MLVLIIIAVVVAAIVGFFGWREFRVPSVNYVTDSIVLDEGGSFRVQRLYAAETNHEAFEEQLETITFITEYEEEERLQAAIASGRPVFFPNFEFRANNFSFDGEDEIWVDGFIAISVAEGQTENRLRMANASLEAVVQGGVEIDRLELFTTFETDKPVKIYNENQATVDISGATAFRVALTPSGTGMLTLQIVYDIEAETPVPIVMLEEQLMQVHVMLEINEFGILETTDIFTLEEYFNLEQLLEG